MEAYNAVNSLLQVIIRHEQFNKARRADTINYIVYLWYKERLDGQMLLWLLSLMILPQLWILKYSLIAPVWANLTAAVDVSRLGPTLITTCL